MKNIWEHLPRPFIYLAPMSGVTNQTYRQMVKSFYADIVCTEFVSVNAIHHGSKKTLRMLEFDKNERPIIAQLFGSDPELFAEATKLIVELGFDGVDLNFGCPAPKIARSGGGCTLLGDLDKCRAIVEATLTAADGKIPVSVKTRMSYKDVTVHDYCDAIKDLPIAAICIHGRPFEKPYLGAADLECIKQAKATLPFPVIASGHAHTPEAAKETLDYTSADGVALARGTFGKPWIGKLIHDYLTTGKYIDLCFDEKLDVMLEHAELAQKNNKEKPIFEMRKVLTWYIKDIPHAADYRAQLVRVKDYQQVQNIVKNIKKNAEKP